MALPRLAGDYQGLFYELAKSEGDAPSGVSPSLVPTDERRARAIVSDDRLAERVRAGDQAAFSELFEQYFLPLAGFADSITGSPDVARDVVHDVLLRIWINRATWAPKSGIAPYLFTAVRNVSRTRVRDANYASATTASLFAANETVGMADLPPDGFEATVIEERQRLLREAIGRLVERRREVIVLRWSGGLQFKEIAEVLGLTVRAVESLHARAIADLRESLRGRIL